jgi:hypothetical protein
MSEGIPYSILLDPVAQMPIANFRYIYESWAKDSPDPMSILCRFEVTSITHSKSHDNTEHEYLIAETVDKGSESGLTRLFVFDRVDSRKKLTAEDTLSASIPTLGQKLKKLGSSAVSLVSSLRSDEELRSAEEGSPFSASSTSLASIDRSTVLMTQGTDVLLSLDKAEITRAEDRIRGHSHANSLKCHGQIAKYFKPNDLTLYELACMAEVIHRLYPSYTVQAEQCYFYAGLLYQATMQQFGQVDLHDIDSHLSDNRGRFAGIKVCDIKPEWSTSVVAKYKEAYRDQLADVSRFFPTKIISLTFDADSCNGRGETRSWMRYGGGVYISALVNEVWRSFHRCV